MTTFGGHSFEQYYQSVRRFWRFGQESPVVVDHVVSDGERGVLRNLRRKAGAADKMFDRLIEHVRDELAISREVIHFAAKERLPTWL
jgi:hypothetical protein